MTLEIADLLWLLKRYMKWTRCIEVMLLYCSSLFPTSP